MAHISRFSWLPGGLVSPAGGPFSRAATMDSWPIALSSITALAIVIGWIIGYYQGYMSGYKAGLNYSVGKVKEIFNNTHQAQAQMRE